MNWPPDFSTLNDRLCERDERQSSFFERWMAALGENIPIQYLGYAGNHQEPAPLNAPIEQTGLFYDHMREHQRAALRRTLEYIITMALGKPPKKIDPRAEPVRFTYGDVIAWSSASAQITSSAAG